MNFVFPSRIELFTLILMFPKMLDMIRNVKTRREIRIVTTIGDGRISFEVILICTVGIWPVGMKK